LDYSKQSFPLILAVFQSKEEIMTLTLPEKTGSAYMSPSNRDKPKIIIIQAYKTQGSRTLKDGYAKGHLQELGLGFFFLKR
jgi:hypothetical protein